MPTYRTIYMYHFKLGNKVVQTGLTFDIDRREWELRQEHGGKGRIAQVGNRTTPEFALTWAREQEALGKEVSRERGIRVG